MQALDDLKNEATAAIALAEDSVALEKLRVEFLGKKGSVTDLLKSLGQLDSADRPKAGAEINELKQLLNNLIGERKQLLQRAAIREQLEQERLDVTLSGRFESMGLCTRLPAQLTAWQIFLRVWVFRWLRDLKSKTITITLRRSIFLRITRRGRCTIRFTSMIPTYFAPTPQGYRFEPWRRESRRSE